MVPNNTKQTEGFYLDATGMALPNIGAFSSPTDGNTTSQLEDPNKKVRKPYTITKSRENWTEPEHDKFLEALQLFDRDWKKIEAFVGSKTVIQIRSHAQKYFLKVQKSGTNEHLPPPRPKRKASHPYPHKASKIAPLVSQELSSLQASPAIPDTEFVVKNTDSACVPSRTEKTVIGDPCGSNESTQRLRPTILPDFAQVYRFIGSVFDPNETGHLHKLKKMDPIDIETVLLLMTNLSINLTSPDFEDHRRVLSSCENVPEKDNAFDVTAHVLVSQSGEAA